MDDCLFCKIIKKEVPSEIIYEDNTVFAFLDISPVNKGHTLLVPKNHSTDLTEASDEEASAMIVKAKELGSKIMKAVGADGFNVGFNTKPAAGQIIFHTHLHIIPRFKNDGLKHWPSARASEEELAEVKNSIVTFLKE